MLTHSLIDWLTDWPPHLLTDRLNDWPVDWLMYWLTDWLTHWLIDWHFNWLIEWLAYQLPGQLTGWLAYYKLPTDCVTDHKPIDRQSQADRLAGGLIDSLTNWLGWCTEIRSSYEMMWQWCESGLLIAYNEDGHFSFQIRCVQQMCQDFNSQELELIFSAVSVVHFAL